MANIHSKLAKASSSMGTLIKSAVNKFEGYNYVSSDDVVYHAREALIGAGLAFYESGAQLTPIGDRLYMHITYVVAECDGDGVISFATDVPIHLDKKGVQLDKQSAASRTYGLAYALRGLLLADRVEKPRAIDEEEPDARKPDVTEQKSKPSKETEEKLVLWNKLKKLRDMAPDVAKSLGMPKDIESMKRQIEFLETPNEL